MASFRGGLLAFLIYVTLIFLAQVRCFSESDTHYERKSSTRLEVFENSLKIDEYKLSYRWYARARYYRAHVDQLDLTTLKINSRTNRGISEDPETSVQEYLTRRNQFFRVNFGSDIILKVILKKDVKSG